MWDAPHLSHTMHPLTHDMMALFHGLGTAHGQYRVDAANKTPKGKKKGVAVTINEPVTVELWGRHLSGIHGLGIVPIMANNCCRFGAIDVDDYDINIEELNTKIQLRRFPLVLCRTKSGGAHLYIFFSEDVDAAAVIEKLRLMSAALGHGKAEIFPKQTKLLIDRGDVGSWINMPYFGADKSDRYALDARSQRLTTDEFVKFAQSRMLTADQLSHSVIELDEILAGGPPCLQRLAVDGFPEGTRNSGLFNLAIYARKAHPDNWKIKLEEYNTRFMQPPLTASETLGVIKAVDKHNYNYTCKTQPIESVCNADKCRRCKFGVGKGDFGMPKFGSLTKLLTEPPIWFIDIEGGHRLAMTTEELQSPVCFQRKCMETLNVVPGIPKRDEWGDILAELFENVNIVEVPKQATPRGHLLALFEEFITSRVQARNREEILLGKPLTQEGTTYFRMRDLVRFLDRQRFSLFDMSEIVRILKDEFDVKEHRFNIHGTIVPCMKMQSMNGATVELADLPGLPKETDPV